MFYCPNLWTLFDALKYYELHRFGSPMEREKHCQKINFAFFPIYFWFISIFVVQNGRHLTGFRRSFVICFISFILVVVVFFWVFWNLEIIKRLYFCVILEFLCDRIEYFYNRVETNKKAPDLIDFDKRYIMNSVYTICNLHNES